MHLNVFFPPAEIAPVASDLHNVLTQVSWKRVKNRTVSCEDEGKLRPMGVKLRIVETGLAPPPG